MTPVHIRPFKWFNRLDWLVAASASAEGEGVPCKHLVVLEKEVPIKIGSVSRQYSHVRSIV